ncbi:class II aldolase/adducin family protein [Streptomyces sp. NPDC001068]|uniref:class II aldolase/adducin family protein n=1 Tax=Streptomyces sp. NPDC001068 TaxID=3364544 RepID=UPI0036A3A78A
MTVSSSALVQERRAVADACGRLEAAGLLFGTSGNVSVRAGNLVAVTATGAELARLTAEQVTVVDLDGNVVSGSLRPTSELGLHLGVYRRYGAGAVVHTHAPTATALSCVLDELPCIHYQLIALGGTVRVAPYATFGTPELAESVLAALDGRSAALMASHGSVTTGATLDQAVENALLLEWACDVYRRAASVGTPRVLDAEQQLAVVEAAIARNYGTTQPLREDRP